MPNDTKHNEPTDPLFGLPIGDKNPPLSALGI